MHFSLDKVLHWEVTDGKPGYHLGPGLDPRPGHVRVLSAAKEPGYRGATNAPGVKHIYVRDKKARGLG